MPRNALMLAPMVELSHRALRELVCSFGGCDRLYTEMTSATGYTAGSRFNAYFSDCAPAYDTTALQLYDTEAEPFVAAARKYAARCLQDGIPMGGIDINFGCSAPRIEKAGGGVFWMKDAARAARLVAAVKEAAGEAPVSVKLRLGYEGREAELTDFCLGLEAAGADYIVVHPRLQNEKFRRRGRWEALLPAARALRIPLIGNGDVRGFADYKAGLERCGLAGIMIGREAVRRPWVFALIRGKEADAAFEMTAPVEETGLVMLDLIRKSLPEAFHLSRAKRFFFYYCDNMSFGHHVRYAIQNALSLEHIQSAFQAYFTDMPQERVITER